MTGDAEPLRRPVPRRPERGARRRRRRRHVNVARAHRRRQVLLQRVRSRVPRSASGTGAHGVHPRRPTARRARPDVSRADRRGRQRTHVRHRGDARGRARRPRHAIRPGLVLPPEIDLGLPFQPFMTALLRARLTDRTASEAVLTGRRYTGDEAVAAGIAHEAVVESALLERAVAIATDAQRQGPRNHRDAQAGSVRTGAVHTRVRPEAVSAASSPASATIVVGVACCIRSGTRGVDPERAAASLARPTTSTSSSRRRASASRSARLSEINARPPEQCDRARPRAHLLLGERGVLRAQHEAVGIVRPQPTMLERSRQGVAPAVDGRRFAVFVAGRPPGIGGQVPARRDVGSDPHRVDDTDAVPERRAAAEQIRVVTRAAPDRVVSPPAHARPVSAPDRASRSRPATGRR